MIRGRRFGKVVTAMTVLVTATAMSSCAGGASGGGPVTLEVWNGFAGTENAALVKVLNKYWAPSHPNIKLQLSANKTADAMTTAMTGSHAPDVIIAPGSQNPSAWWAAGALTDLTPLAKQMQPQLSKTVVKAAIDWGREGSTTIALPFVDFNEGIFYNKTMFKDAGLDPNKPPTTIAELSADATKLTKLDANGNIVQLGWEPAGNTDPIALGLAFGAKFIDAKGQPTLDTPAFQAALNWDVNLAKKVGLPKEEKFVTGFTSGQTPFALGKVAIYIDGDWQAAMLKQSSKVDWGYGAVPTISPSLTDTNRLDTNPIVIPKAIDQSHLKAAEELVKFLTLNPQVSGQFAGDIANIPQVKSQLSSFSSVPADKFFANISESKNAVAWAPVPYSQVYSDQITAVAGKIYSDGAAVGPALAATQKLMVQQANQ